MTERIRIPAQEAQVLRVFAIDDGADDTVPDDALRAALGAPHLDFDAVERFAVADLQEMRLSDYLAEGHGIPEDQLTGLRGRIDGLSGRVLLLPSRAFGGVAQEIAPRAPLRLLARFSEEVPPVRFDNLPAGSAAGAGGRGRPPAPSSPLRGRAALWLVLGLGLILTAGVALVVALGRGGA